MDINFGSKDEKAIIDDNGSTKSVMRSYHNGHAVKTRTTYRLRIKVRDQTEELAEIVRFRKEHPQNHGVNISIEQNKTGETNGFYYLVKSWEE